MMKRTVMLVLVLLAETSFACNSTTLAIETTFPTTTEIGTPTATKTVLPNATKSSRPTANQTNMATPEMIQVTIDGKIIYQTIDGFGACGAFRAASHIHGSTGLSDKQQKEILDLLFNTTTGAGLSIWRNEIGSSSTAGVDGPDDGDNVPSIEPNDPGSPSAAPNYTWDSNDGDQLWLSQQAQTYGVAQFYATAWSAPAYMKTNNSLKNGGYLCGLPGQSCPNGDWRQHFANYLIQYLKYYQEAGINITYIGYQNEPDLSPGYASMNWDLTEEISSDDRGVVDPVMTQNIDFISNYLGPALAEAGLSTKIACCDATSWDRSIIYADGILSNPTASDYVGLITGHGYYSSSAGLLGPRPVKSAIEAGKPVWQSEAAIFDTWNPAWDAGNRDSSGIHWAEVLWDALVNTQVNAYFYWWGAKAYEAGGVTANSPLIKIVENTYEPSKRLWAFANYSRFIRPGATRIEANIENDDIKVSAFKNTDGHYVIVVLNKSSHDESVSFLLQNASIGEEAVPYLTNEENDTTAQPEISIMKDSFVANIPARSLVTYDIAPNGN